MSLELPGWVVDAFNFLGLPWPAIDEDELRGWARDLREFATDLTQLSQLSHDAVHGLKDSNQSGMVKTLAEHWDHHHSQMMAMRGPMHAFAEALDMAAEAVVVQKEVVIGAAVALAIEVIATQGEALFTLGIAEGELPLEIALTKMTVKFALQELENKIIGYLINEAATEISHHANAAIAKMLKGSTNVVFEAVSLKADYKALQRVADTAKKHKNRVETASIRAHRRANARKIETHSAGGRWHVVQVLEAALKSIAEDIFKRLPGTFHQVLDGTEKDLEKAATKLKATDGKVADDAPKPTTEETPSPTDNSGGSAIPPVKAAPIPRGTTSRGPVGQKSRPAYSHKEAAPADWTPDERLSHGQALARKAAVENRTARTAARTYVSGYHVDTGELAVASSGPDVTGGAATYCAEGNVVRLLGGDWTKVRWGVAYEAVKGKTAATYAPSVKPVCPECQQDYPRSHFGPGVTGDPRGVWYQ
ncbi:hypothetical protein [Streptomyces sp. NPDC096012]|uniref:WXG100-like domain-containing protein n=1 Tax=Streptomyces sp. NPDC096012 TaxID=3155684 RepID=UPI00336A82C2